MEKFIELNILPILFTIFFWSFGLLGCLITWIAVPSSSLFSNKRWKAWIAALIAALAATILILIGGILLAPYSPDPSSPILGFWHIFSLAPFFWWFYNEGRKERLHKKNLQTTAQQKYNDIGLLVNTAVLRIFMQHLKALVTKCEQAIYKDDYNQIDSSGAVKEIDYFIEKVIKKNIFLIPLPYNMDKAEFDNYLVANLNEQHFISDVIYEQLDYFLPIKNLEDWELAIYEIASTQSINLYTYRNASEETLKFILGNEYKENYSLTLQLCMSELTQKVIDFSIGSLIRQQELESLKRWFLERFEITENLSQVITGEEFEEFCKRKIQSNGWEVKTTKKTGDFGADLVIERNGIMIVAQCKYYSQPVGVKSVQEAFSAKTFYNADKAVVITNQSYTKAARQMAQKNGVQLLSIIDLENLG